jgi:DNA invertase Pin-like site-specific DNA recombinase
MTTAKPAAATATEQREADLVTAIFDVLTQTHPELQAIRQDGEQAVRQRLAGMRGTVTIRPDSDTTARRVLALFNGRNARTVARQLGISRATVYRLLKQPGATV